MKCAKPLLIGYFVVGRGRLYQKALKWSLQNAHVFGLAYQERHIGIALSPIAVVVCCENGLTFGSNFCML